jgi:hypothetical protein
MYPIERALKDPKGYVHSTCASQKEVWQRDTYLMKP